VRLVTAAEAAGTVVSNQGPRVVADAALDAVERADVLIGLRLGHAPRGQQCPFLELVGSFVRADSHCHECLYRVGLVGEGGMAGWP